MGRLSNLRKRVVALTAGGLLTAGMAVGLTATPAFAATCTTSSASGGCSYTNDPSIYNDGNNSEVVQQDVFSQPAGWAQTLTANSMSSWKVTATEPAGHTAVVSYPNSQVTMTLPTGTGDPVSDFGPNFTSSYNDTFPSGSGQDYEWAYDLWLSSGPSWQKDQEIMLWTGNHGQRPAGNDLGKTWTDKFGVTWEIWASTGSNTASSTYQTISLVRSSPATSGTIDVSGLFNFLTSNGYSNASGLNVDQFDYGLEICSTGGAALDYVLNSYDMVKGTGGTGQVAPLATSSAATAVTSTGATLNGSINPEGAATTYQFDYGTSSSYGSVVPAGGASGGSGTTSENETADLTGLTPSTTYHYRVEATNSAGTTDGTDQTFTTSASGVTGTQDTVTATATNPHDDTVLKVFDVDNGQTGGKFVVNGGFSNPSFTLTPNVSGSILVEGAEVLNGSTAVTPAANNTTTDSGTTAGVGAPYWFGKYTGAVTAGTAASMGGTDGATWSTWAGYEVEPQTGLTASLDSAGTPPAADSGADSEGSVSTAAFTPAAGSELVAIVEGNGNAAQALAVSDANGLNWTEQGSTYSAAFDGSIAVFTAAVPGSGGGTGGTAPVDATNAATAVTSTGATLNGSVNPEGSATTYQFDYGTTTGYGSSVPAAPGSAGSGTSSVSESAPVTGLAPNTLYHYRVEATNATGTTLGSDQTFTTSVATVTAPAATTNAATGVAQTAATLNGSVNPEGAATTYQFQYGPTTSYGSTIPATAASAGSGTTAVNESASLTGLTASTTYHYRIVATNSGGTTNGSDQSFTTAAAPVGNVFTNQGTHLNDWNLGTAVNQNNGVSPNNDFMIITNGSFVNLEYVGPGPEHGMCVGDLGNDPNQARAGMVSCNPASLGWGANFTKVTNGSLVGFKSAHWANGYLAPKAPIGNGNPFYNNNTTPTYYAVSAAQ